MQKEYFINLSNHSTTKWSDKQLNSALELANHTIDVSFPQINPSSTCEDINSQARKYFDDITSHFTTDIIIHIMGEMSFIYAFVAICEANNVPCICSTTERKSIESVDENGNTIKNAVFEFVQFRPYF